MKITTVGGSIGGPGSCYPAVCNNFSGAGFSPAWSQQGAVSDPLANVPQCGNGSPGTVNYCPTTNRTDGSNGSTLLPGIYSEIKNSHTLSPGVYVLTGDITLNGNDLIQGDGVMLYFACSNYPTPCAAGEEGAGIKATGNGALRLTGITQAQCTAIGEPVSLRRNDDLRRPQQHRHADLARQRHQRERVSQRHLRHHLHEGGLMDLRGNGYQMASQIVVDRFTMEGNPSTVTISYDQSKNYTETHTGHDDDLQRHARQQRPLELARVSSCRRRAGAPSRRGRRA